MFKNILLTGATGFLGSHLLRKLLELNYNITLIVRASSNLNRIEKILDKVKLFLVQDDLSNLNSLFTQNPVEAIIHTATEYGKTDYSTSKILESNLIFPIKLIEQGMNEGLKLFINTDTFFGKYEYNYSNYIGSYVISKNHFNEYLKEQNLPSLKVINMRLEHVFGENDSKSKFFCNLMQQLIEDKNEIFLTEGIQKRDFIYIDDVVSAYLKVLEFHHKLDTYTEFQVGRGESIEVKKFVHLLWQITRSKSNLKFGSIPRREGDIQDSKANNQNLTELGWKSNYDLESAFNKILATINTQNSLI